MALWSCVLSILLCAVFAVSPPQISPIRLPENLEEGQRLSILCAVQKGTPPIEFQWRKGNQLVTAGDFVKINHNGDYEETLQILKLGVDHVGNYTCSAKNPFGSDQMSARVLLKYRPKWLSTQNITSIIAVANSAIQIDCQAEGHPRPVVKFLRQKG